MKNIKKYYSIKAAPSDVFTALTNPLTIEMWSGYPAIMEAVSGTDFSLWDGDITGTNLEIIPGSKIVQRWDFDGEEAESIVTIELHPSGNDTRVELLHINIPDDAFENILDGWDNYYFKPIKLLLEE